MEERVRRGDASAIAALALALMVISIVFFNVVLTSKEAFDMENEAAMERLTVSVKASAVRLDIVIRNDGPIWTSIIAIRVSNGSCSIRYSAHDLTGADVIDLSPGEEFEAKLKPISKGSYNVVIAITTRGNKFSGADLVPS